METQINTSRRNFLKFTATALTALSVTNFASTAIAKEFNNHKIDLRNLPSDPYKTVKDSKLVQGAWDYLLHEINALENSTLRTKILNIYQETYPTFMNNYQSKDEVAKVYQELLDNGLVDPKVTTAKTLFPPIKGVGVEPQLFMTAPGSGYKSHHAYPGGLVTHTAVNVQITKAILRSYQEVMGYKKDWFIAIAAQLLHDLAKPYVFQWNEDGSCLQEYQIAGTGAHHIFSIAESVTRGIPANVVVAQACAHNHPGSEADEIQVVNWIKAACIIAKRDPIALGLLEKDGKHIPTPHKQAGYIVHLGDHDFVLSSPACQNSVVVLKNVAKNKLKFSDADLNGAKFNYLRNYVGAHYSYMHMHDELSNGNPEEIVYQILKELFNI